MQNAERRTQNCWKLALRAVQFLVYSVLGASVAGAQPTVASLDAQRGVAQNLYTAPEDIEAGARSYRSRCVICHGPEGAGDRGPNLARGIFRHGTSDRQIFLNILAGIPGTGMPSVRLSDKEVWQVVAYIRSLSRRPASSDPAGNADAGRGHYRRAGCQECHWIAGEGGRLGPDLTNIGWIRSAEHLRRSIIDPDRNIEDRYRQVRVGLKDGRRVQGMLLNEDAFSVQLRDTDEQLRSFVKDRVAGIERPATSLMPSFRNQFTEEQLDDLVAYLASLR